MKTNRPPPQHARVSAADSGSVLILALWSLFVLAALALVVGSRVTASVRVAETARRATRGYWLARAGMAFAAREVASNTNAWDAIDKDSWNLNPDRFAENSSAGDGWFLVVAPIADREADPRYVAGVVGEESKIHINKADPLTLAAMFRKLGNASSRRADELAQAVVAWRSRPRHVDAGDRVQSRTAVEAPGAPSRDNGFWSVQELTLVEGIDDKLFAALFSSLTVFGSGRINVNTASERVLTVLAESVGVQGEAAGEAARAIMAARPASSLSEMLSALEGTAQSVLRRAGERATVESECFGGTALGSLSPFGHDDDDGSRSRLPAADGRVDFVVDKNGTIMFWHEY